MEKLLEVSRVAKRLSLDASTIRRMFNKGVLLGIRTDTTGTRIRIYESSVMQHIQRIRAGNVIQASGIDNKP